MRHVSLFLLTLGLIVLFCGCGSRPAPPTPTDQTTLYVDTTRIHLQHRADESAGELLIVRHRASQTQTPYEQFRQRYDSIRVTLP
ncbi:MULTISPECIES: hypothetical protein [Spirosoma]|uniref:Uncharacterized protein n=1 Tax=Spirosoma sordidisoli TaxID=2502893 RepID=A0A4Q2UQ89_9BACT|nr:MULTISPECIES: hypothetical protein [Spirosoma]RYC69815.1 hypothetical protein EQG79_14575 [Spirosoma sordidisoli]